MELSDGQQVHNEEQTPAYHIPCFFRHCHVGLSIACNPEKVMLLVHNTLDRDMLFGISVDALVVINHLAHRSAHYLINKHEGLFLCNVEDEWKVAEELDKHNDLRNVLEVNVATEHDMVDINYIFVHFMRFKIERSNQEEQAVDNEEDRDDYQAQFHSNLPIQIRSIKLFMDLEEVYLETKCKAK